MNIESYLDAYSGGAVDREIVEIALDFMVSLEPDASDPNGWENYKLIREEQGNRIKVVEKILRAYGESIEPKTLDAMQTAFYSFSNSYKYRASAASISCVSACLNSAWDGIGPWRK